MLHWLRITFELSGNQEFTVRWNEWLGGTLRRSVSFLREAGRRRRNQHPHSSRFQQLVVSMSLRNVRLPLQSRLHAPPWFYLDRDQLGLSPCKYPVQWLRLHLN